MTKLVLMAINEVLAELLAAKESGQRAACLFIKKPLAVYMMNKWKEETYHLEYTAPETCQTALLPRGCKLYKLLHKGKTRYMLGTYAHDASDGRNLMLDLLNI